jgi:tetratricopeptide (TPR) repeat protein
MDWLDRLSIAAVAVLAAGTFALVQGHRGEAKPVRSMQHQQVPAGAQASDRGELDKALTAAKNLLDAGNPGKAEALLSGLAQRHPYESEPRMLMGDVLMRKLEPVRAMHVYREAIDLNPDYLDKKTPLFQGKKLKVAVGEALAEIESRLKQSPGDETLKAEKKIIYYLYRRIAGSCG